MTSTKQDFQFMRMALEISYRALPNCRPNPPVGCVIVDNQKIIAVGYTDLPGRYHAEAYAIHKIKKYPATNGLVLYSTLEPCSFYGRTPSCAETIAKDKRIEKVFVAVIDPDPRNNGRGIEILKNSGKTVITSCLEDEALAFLQPFLYHN